MRGLFARSSRRRTLSVLGAVAVLLSLVVVRADAEGPLDLVLGEPEYTYPDLQPDVQNVLAYREILGFNGTTFTYGNAFLDFDTWSKNIGTVPLQLTVEGIDEADVTSPTVAQCVSWLADRVCREQREVGGFSWHTEHAHFHYQDFATYTLRRLLSDGTPDYSAAGVVAISEKVSFCLIDIEDLDTEDDQSLPFYTTGKCLAPAVMGISPRWADVYDASIPGQTLPLTGLTDGSYALVVDQDTANSLWETDDTNNRVVATITLAGMATDTPTVTGITRAWPTTGGGGTTTTTTTSTTTTSTTTSTTSTSTSTTSTTVCRGGGGGGGGGGHGGGGGGGGGKCRR